MRVDEVAGSICQALPPGRCTPAAPSPVGPSGYCSPRHVLHPEPHLNDPRFLLVPSFTLWIISCSDLASSAHAHTEGASGGRFRPRFECMFSATLPAGFRGSAGFFTTTATSADASEEKGLSQVLTEAGCMR